MSLEDELAQVKADCEAKLEALKNAAVTEIRKLESWALNKLGIASPDADTTVAVQEHTDAVAAVEAVHADLSDVKPAVEDAAQTQAAADTQEAAGTDAAAGSAVVQPAGEANTNEA